MSVTSLHRGRFLELVRDARGWEWVRRTNATGVVGIVAITDAAEILLVEQHRAPLGAPTLELPAGLAGDDVGRSGEAGESAVIRELVEETGYEPRTVTFLGRTPSSAGLTDEVTDLFLAEGLRKVAAGGGVDGEDIRTHVVPLADVDGWLRARVDAGALVDPKVYAGLYFHFRRPPAR